MIFDANIDWMQMARYFSGEAPPEERAVIEARIDSDETFCEALELARKVWHVTGIPSMGVDKQKAWQAIDLEIQQQGRLKENLRLVRQDRTAVRQSAKNMNRRSSRLVFVSAFVVILVTGLYFFIDGNPAEQALPEVAVFKTTAGQRASITLPDGSEAMLNAESQIQVLTGVSDPVRIIELDGEAFFSVVSDASKPFIVRVGDAEIRVVGTSFNVSAYPDQQSVQVLVTEGEVQFGKRGEKTEDVTLLKHDLGVLPAGGVPSRSPVASIEKMLAWRHGGLVFDNSSLEEVARTLERWFDLEIHISDAEIANRHLSSSFLDPTPNHVIATIARTLSLDYTIQENVITFSIPERQ